MDKIKYLEDERIKLWDAVEELRKKIKKFTPEEITALTAQLNQIQQLLDASQATESQYQEILRKAKSTNTEIDTSLEAVTEKRQALEDETTKAQANIKKIEQIVQKALAVSEQADEVTTTLETTETEINEKQAALSEVAEIHAGIEEFQQKIELLHKNILEKEKATSELYRHIFGYIAESTEEVRWPINDGFQVSYATPLSLPGRVRFRRPLGRRTPEPGVIVFDCKTLRCTGTRFGVCLPRRRMTDDWSTRA